MEEAKRCVCGARFVGEEDLCPVCQKTETMDSGAELTDNKDENTDSPEGE